MIHSNPFTRRKVLDSSERMKLKIAKTLIKDINNQNERSITTKNYTVKDNEISKVISYEMLLGLTKGFFQINNQNCNIIKNYVQSVSQGLYSYQIINDPSCGFIKNNYKKSCSCDKNSTKCSVKGSCCNNKCQPRVSNLLYVVDNCRLIKGYITPTALIDPIQKESGLQFPSKIFKQPNKISLLYNRVFTAGLQTWVEKNYINGYLSFVSSSSENKFNIVIRGTDKKRNIITETVKGSFANQTNSVNEYDTLFDLSSNSASTGSISVYAIPTCNYKIMTDNTIPVDIHSDLCGTNFHVYRTNNKMNVYEHNHSKDKDCEDPPFPNRDATNPYSFFDSDNQLVNLDSKYYNNTSSGSKIICLKCKLFSCCCPK